MKHAVAKLQFSYNRGDKMKKIKPQSMHDYDSNSHIKQKRKRKKGALLPGHSLN